MSQNFEGWFLQEMIPIAKSKSCKHFDISLTWEKIENCSRFIPRITLKENGRKKSGSKIPQKFTFGKTQKVCKKTTLFQKLCPKKKQIRWICWRNTSAKPTDRLSLHDRTFPDTLKTEIDFTNTKLYVLFKN